MGKRYIPGIIDDNGTRNTHPLQKYNVALKQGNVLKKLKGKIIIKIS